MLDTRQDVTHQTELSQDIRVPVVVIEGDGVGPEVTGAAQKVLSAAFAGFDWIKAEAGAIVMDQGQTNGLPSETLSAIDGAGLVLKGPLATPIGYGGKSVNVTLRKLYELYGNVRPIQGLPGVTGPFAGRDIDFTILRENVEDLYAGVEHMQTPDVAQCLKLITRKGSEKIIRLAYSMAQSEARSRLHVVTKANIMKLTEGLFKRVAAEMAREFPKIDQDHMLVDNCAQQMVIRPEQFELLVTTNMNGDILSDLAAGLIGGLGLAPSANIGDQIAMFEAVHGSAPDIAGKGVANPTAMIRSGVMLLRHIGQAAAAQRLEMALAKVYQTGTALTPDVAPDGQAVSTNTFVDALLDALHAEPPIVSTPREKPGISAVTGPAKVPVPAERQFDGIDVFVEWGGDVETLVEKLDGALHGNAFDLQMISNRGTLVWPNAIGQPDTVDHWRCRLMRKPGTATAEQRIPAVLAEMASWQLRWMHVEKLESINGAPGYSLAQGQV